MSVIPVDLHHQATFAYITTVLHFFQQTIFYTAHKVR